MIGETQSFFFIQKSLAHRIPFKYAVPFRAAPHPHFERRTFRLTFEGDEEVLMMAEFCKRAVLGLLTLSFVTLASSVSEAKMLSTSAAIRQISSVDQRARAIAFIEQKTVQNQLVAWGVDPTEARERVAALSDAEISRFNAELDRLPAGQDGLGVVVGAAVFVFLVLLVTDILGITDVFPFVKKTVR